MSCLVGQILKFCGDKTCINVNIFVNYSHWFLSTVCPNRFDTLRVYFHKSNFNFGRSEFLMAVNIDITHQKCEGIYVGIYALTFLKKLLLPTFRVCWSVRNVGTFVQYLRYCHHTVIIIVPYISGGEKNLYPPF